MLIWSLKSGSVCVSLRYCDTRFSCDGHGNKGTIELTKQGLIRGSAPDLVEQVGEFVIQREQHGAFANAVIEHARHFAT